LAYDPYRRVHAKIESARKKFKDLEGSYCCLARWNNDKPLVELDWQFGYDGNRDSGPIIFSGGKTM
jgi:hypothetical protein